MRYGNKVAEAKTLFSRAALSLCSWDEAMAAMARAANCRTGQLIGMGEPTDLRFNVMTELDPASLVEFVTVGGADPAINSRVRIGLERTAMTWFGDADLTAEQDAARSPEFADWIARNRLGECRLITLIKEDGALLGAGVVRDSAQDAFTDIDIAVLEELGSSLREAVLLQQAIETEQAAIVAGSFDRIGKALFVCALNGRIMAMSPRAERLLAEGRWFVSRTGQLHPANPHFAAYFAALLKKAGLPLEEASNGEDAAVLRDKAGAPLLVRAYAFPAENPFRLNGAVLVVPCLPEERESELAAMAAKLFDLTSSEGVVLAHLVGGRKPDRIAALLGVKPSTIRSHLKSIFLKTGARSQLEVSALLRTL